MAGLASPDVPAFWCYLIVIVVGFFVARAHVVERLKDYPDHWAFFSAWLLLIAYWVIPPLLFWFLDYTGAIQDTSLFAALLVAFGYRQLFAGGIHGVSMPGQTSALWKPFQAWVDKVAERIQQRQKRYIDRFAEHLRSDITQDQGKLDKLENLALQRTQTPLDQLRQAIAAARAIPEQQVARSRLFDQLWPNLKTSAPTEYGYLLHKHGLVKFGRRWWWLERGRAKTVLAGALLLALVVLVAGFWFWASRDPLGATLWEMAQRRYYQWRFLKANATERDRWRSGEYFSRELQATIMEPLPPLAEAKSDAQRVRDEIEAIRRTHDSAKTEDERSRAKTALAVAEAKATAALHVETRAVRTDALVRPLIKELRYPEITSRRLDDITRLLINHRSPQLNAYYVPELIETLQTSNEIVRLGVHKTLLELQKADYPKFAPPKDLALWVPKKNESAADVDRFIRLWLEWWRSTEITPRRSGRP